MAAPNVFPDSPGFDASVEHGRNDGFICGNVIGRVPGSLSDNRSEVERLSEMLCDDNSHAPVGCEWIEELSVSEERPSQIAERDPNYCLQLVDFILPRNFGKR